MLAKPISTHIMNIQAEPMAGAVHVEMAVRALFNQAIHIPLQETEAHQTLHQNAHGRVVHTLSGLTRSHTVNRGLLRSQHKAVELTLLAAEATIHRERSRDVAVVVVRQ